MVIIDPETPFNNADKYGVVYSPDGKNLLKCENKNITEYKVKEGTVAIDDNAFSDCALTSITIPNSVESIGGGAFSGCFNLKSITIPKGVRHINSRTFCGCRSLQSIDIPDTVTSIGWEAFKWCEWLQDIRIPNSVIEIEDGAFNSCGGLNTVYIPASVTKIGLAAFANCGDIDLNAPVPKVATFRQTVDCHLTIKCEAPSKPDGWDKNWVPDDIKVEWGVQDF